MGSKDIYDNRMVVEVTLKDLGDDTYNITVVKTNDGVIYRTRIVFNNKLNDEPLEFTYKLKVHGYSWGTSQTKDLLDFIKEKYGSKIHEILKT